MYVGYQKSNLLNKNQNNCGTKEIINQKNHQIKNMEKDLQILEKKVSEKFELILQVSFYFIILNI